MQDGLALLERAADKNRKPTGLDVLQEAAADNAPIGERLQQTASSLVGSAFDTAETLGRFIQRVEPFGLGLPSEEEKAKYPKVYGPGGQLERQRDAIVPDAVPGQEDKLYSQVAGMAGSTAVLAPFAAVGGPLALGGAGAAIGAERGLEEAQAAGATPGEATLAALGYAVIGATQTYGPAKALARFGIKPGSPQFSILNDILTPGVQGAGQSIGEDVVAGQTFDRGRAVDLGRAMETALASMVVGGGTAGGVKLLELAAMRRGQSVPKESPEKAQATPTDQPTSDVRATEPIPGMPEEAPAYPVIQGQEPRSSPDESVSAPDVDPGAPPVAPTSVPDAEVGAPNPRQGVPVGEPYFAGFEKTESAPAPQTPTAAPDEGLTKAVGADSDPADVRAEGYAERGPDQPVKVTREQAAIGEDADTIALRHETTAAKRAARGFPEYERNPSRTDVELRQGAIDALTADPFAGRKLVERIASSDHKPSDAESFLLLAEANRLRNEVKLADVEFVKDPSPKNKALLDLLNAEFQKALDVTDRVGSEQGKAFRVRAQQMREDYTLAGVVRKKAKALGRSLNEAEMEHAREVTRKLDELEKRVTEAETRQDTIEADRIAQEKVETLKREVRARAPRQQRIQRNRAEMDTILSRLASRKAHSGLDPEMALDVLKFAKLAIENGVLKFADFAADIVKAGEHVRPYLQKAWDQAVSERHAELVTPVRERFKAGEAPGRALDTLALHLVESGITERDALIDALHKAVPDASREQIRDALSRYGQFKQASQEESHKTLRQLKQEMQKVAQIEALEKRMAPLKTGFDRGEPSAEYRRLAKRVEALKKETGIRPPVDPERALKSAEASRETYLRNRITDLRDEISTGKREARQRGEPPTNPTIAALEAELSIVQDEHASTFKKPSKTPEEKSAARDKARIAAIERTAKHYEKMVENWDVGTKEKPKPIDSPEYRAAVAHRDAARAVVEELRALANPKATPEERATKAALSRIATDTAKLQQRITFKDFGPREKKVSPTPSSEVVKARSERDAMKRQFQREAYQDERARRSTAKKIVDAAKETLNLPKAVFSAFDVSAVGRQGAFFTAQDLLFRQKQLGVRLGRMFRALASEEYANRVQAMIESDPSYETLKRGGVQFTGMLDPLTAKEEAYQSTLSDKIPGIKHSNRAFVVYSNLLRLEHGKRMLAASDGSPQAVKAISNMVNAGSGRGNVGKGKFASFVREAGAVLWAPSLLISRFQLLLGQPFVGGTAQTRLMFAKEYATSLAALASVYALVEAYAAMNPDDPDKPEIWDGPLSSDSGKIKMGATRVDPLAGLQQTARLLTTEAVALSGGKTKDSPINTAWRFLKTKFTPSITVPYELVTGKSFAYDFEIKDRAAHARNILVPLSFRDIYDAMQDQGVPKGAALGILSLFGVGLEVHEKDKRPASRAPVVTR